MRFLFTEEENQFTQSQGNATATVAAISTLLIVVVIIVGICLAVQIGYKLAKSKKRYVYNYYNNSYLYRRTIF